MPEQLFDGPDVLGQTCCHRRGSPDCRFRSKTSMHRAEIVDRSKEVEARFEGRPGAGQVPRLAREYGKSLSEDPVQAFDVAG